MADSSDIFLFYALQGRFYRRQRLDRSFPGLSQRFRRQLKMIGKDLAKLGRVPTSADDVIRNLLDRLVPHEAGPAEEEWRP